MITVTDDNAGQPLPRLWIAGLAHPVRPPRRPNWAGRRPRRMHRGQNPDYLCQACRASWRVAADGHVIMVDPGVPNRVSQTED